MRLAEMNEIALQLMSLGQTEAALKIQTQIEELNTKWNSLQQMAQVGLFYFCLFYQNIRGGIKSIECIRMKCTRTNVFCGCPQRTVLRRQSKRLDDS